MTNTVTILEIIRRKTGNLLELETRDNSMQRSTKYAVVHHSAPFLGGGKPPFCKVKNERESPTSLIISVVLILVTGKFHNLHRLTFYSGN